MRRPIAILAAGVALALGATPAQAANVIDARPGAHRSAPVNGRIAFREYFNAAQTRGAIFTIRPDGQGLRRVTHRGGVALDTEPNWAPDGRRIAFSRIPLGRVARVYSIRADGSHALRLSSGPSEGDEFPAWAPHGRRIMFTRLASGTLSPSLFVMRSDGSRVRQISGSAARNASFAEWSPDAKRIVFEGTRKNGRGRAVFTMRLDGTHLHRLTPWKLHAGDGADWSPNGRWILLESHTGQDRRDNVFLVHPDGTDLHKITTSPGDVHWGSYSFSPDGTRITVSRRPGVGSAGNPDVWTMRLDGSDLTNVTMLPGFDSAPDWGPRPR